jgi:carboxypeptidase family protein
MSRKGRLMIKSGIIGLVVALSMLGTGVAQSTAPTGTIQGSVMDSSGAIIAGVRVTAVQEASGNARTTETDATGHFHFGGLAIGKYSLRAEQQGFSTVLAAAAKGERCAAALATIPAVDSDFISDWALRRR